MRKCSSSSSNWTRTAVPNSSKASPPNGLTRSRKRLLPWMALCAFFTHFHSSSLQTVPPPSLPPRSPRLIPPNPSRRYTTDTLSPNYLHRHLQPPPPPHRNQGDLDEFSKLAHYLKGSSGQLGVIKLQSSCAKLQHLG